MSLCFILDGVLILYGIILTVLYCRLRKHSSEGNIYAGLHCPANDTYDIIQKDKQFAV